VVAGGNDSAQWYGRKKERMDQATLLLYTREDIELYFLVVRTEMGAISAFNLALEFSMRKTFGYCTRWSFPLSFHGASARCGLILITAFEATHTTRYAWDGEIQGSRHAYVVRSLGGRNVSMIAGVQMR
jgi:hypothetical protein